MGGGGLLNWKNLNVLIYGRVRNEISHIGQKENELVQPLQETVWHQVWRISK